MPVEGEQNQQRTIREILSRLDLLGGASGVTALVLFNFAWNQSLVTTWDEPYVYVCLILSFLFLVAYKWHKLCTSTDNNFRGATSNNCDMNLCNVRSYRRVGA